MFRGRIFFDAIRNTYGKSEQNDKNTWMMVPTWSLLFLLNFFLIKNLPAFFNTTLVSFAYIMQNLPTYCWKTLVSFFFLLQNLLAYALFTLVSFFFLTKLTSMCTVYAGKFFNNKKIWTKSSNDYMGPIIQAFCRFLIFQYASTICASPYQFSTINNISEQSKSGLRRV